MRVLQCQPCPGSSPITPWAGGGFGGWGALSAGMGRSGLDPPLRFFALVKPHQGWAAQHYLELELELHPVKPHQAWAAQHSLELELHPLGAALEVWRLPGMELPW